MPLALPMYEGMQRLLPAVSFANKEKTMSITSVASGVNLPATAHVPTAPEAGEKTVNGRDARNDGDADDGATTTAAPASAAPTVNTSGQTVGTLVNVKA
jgi:hypothetical protein